MTILFGGIDIPVYEVMFISAILFFAGVVIMIMGIFYILKELKTLKSLIHKEEADITKFEKGIDKLEDFEEKEEVKKEEAQETQSDSGHQNSKTVLSEKKEDSVEPANSSRTDQVKQYIKDSKDKGFAWEKIKENLVKQGWEDAKLEEIHKEIQ